jgi:adenylosuccinate synthase
VLDKLSTVPVCVGYRCEERRLAEFPNCLGTLKKCVPIYEEFPGWQQETSRARRWEELPPNAQRYVERVGEMVGVPVGMVRVGPQRDQTILR